VKSSIHYCTDLQCFTKENITSLLYHSITVLQCWFLSQCKGGALLTRKRKSRSQQKISQGSSVKPLHQELQVFPALASCDPSNSTLNFLRSGPNTKKRQVHLLLRIRLNTSLSESFKTHSRKGNLESHKPTVDPKKSVVAHWNYNPARWLSALKYSKQVG